MVAQAGERFNGKRAAPGCGIIGPMKRFFWLFCGIVFPFQVPAQTVPPSATEFVSCVQDLRREATARGVDGAVFDRALTGIEPDASVLEAMDNQPEFKLAIWDYMAVLVDEQRIADGRKRLEQWAEVLAAIEHKFGVDRHVVVAVWGIESDYGNLRGGRPLVRSLATVSCFGGRQRFFRGELIATLRILQAGDVPAEQLVGSWAGAFGQTQFMPSTFQRTAVDFDGDGRRDIVGSVPDALASAANYLKRAGWESGEPWGIEIRLPSNYGGPSGRRNRRPLVEWARLGMKRIDGEPVAGRSGAGLLLPAGSEGPAFLVFRNFDALYSYNAAESYALAIGHLADRIRGGGPIVQSWPRDELPLSRSERIELQQRLSARGYNLGDADGHFGPKTRDAIRDLQARAGMVPDGFVSVKFIDWLRRN